VGWIWRIAFCAYEQYYMNPTSPAAQPARRCQTLPQSPSQWWGRSWGPQPCAQQGLVAWGRGGGGDTVCPAPLEATTDVLLRVRVQLQSLIIEATRHPPMPPTQQQPLPRAPPPHHTAHEHTAHEQHHIAPDAWHEQHSPWAAPPHLSSCSTRSVVACHAAECSAVAASTCCSLYSRGGLGRAPLSDLGPAHNRLGDR